jgi:uncharacterized protein
LGSLDFHCSRLLTLISSPVSDMLKSAYSFGGISATQRAKPYVDNWLAMRQDVQDAVKNFSIYVLATTVGDRLSGNTTDGNLDNRVSAKYAMRLGRGEMALDVESVVDAGAA